ncbi:hypothetical protein BGZ49_003914 [Haplosporangium sp. Z 27]|nr:hypothetical protein BGZ49_003914 [Haplosporangium sp. Z 27]
MHQLFELPEIVLHIVRFLDVSDILACYSTSRSLRILLTPLVWNNVHFGKPLQLDLDQEPFVRRIYYKSRRQEDDWDHISAIFKENESWIKSLSIYNPSLTPLKLAEICTGLESLTLRGFSSCSSSKEAIEYWDCYRKLIQKQQSSVRSLTFLNWVFNPGNIPLPDDPIWNGVSCPNDVPQLRSLTLKHCRIRGRHLSSFSMMCQQLETLELIDTEVDLYQLRATVQANDSQLTPTHPAPQYPELRNLTIQRMTDIRPQAQLDLMICECPKLQTLIWDISMSYNNPKREFIGHMLSHKWPCLNSITISCLGQFAREQDIVRILETAKQPFRRLDLMIDCIGSTIFDLLRANHFTTLQTIDLRRCNEPRSEWIIEVLTSCPALECIKGEGITRQEIVNSKPWVCTRLKNFVVYIDMGKLENDSTGRFTNEEIQQCHTIFQRLSTLRELKILDMLSPYVTAIAKQSSDIRYKKFSLVPLPLRLKAGLHYLSSLTKLEKVYFWGGMHPIPKKDLIWIVNHWKRLVVFRGGWRIAIGSAAADQDKYLWSGKLQEWMASMGIDTKNGYREEYRPRDQKKEIYEDYCGISDEDDE